MQVITGPITEQLHELNTTW